MRIVLATLVAGLCVAWSPAGSDTAAARGPAIVAAPAGSTAAFVLRDRHAAAFFSDGTVSLSLRRHDGRQRWAVRWSADGMAGLAPQPRDRQPGLQHELLGRAWRTDLERWGAVAYGDVLIESRRQSLKYTIAAPQARTMRCRYEGADEVLVAPDGVSLEIRLADGGTLREHGLVCTQNGQPVRARYADARADGSYAIEFVDADPTRPVVVDPVIDWSQYVGGAGGPFGIDGDVFLAADATHVYATGWTESTDFPVTTGAFDTDTGGTGGDGFVMKLTPDGTVEWSTFLGGADSDQPTDVAVDASGNVYVTGCTLSVDFPIVGGFDATGGGSWDCFVAKLTPAGNALIWSSYFGGSATDNPIAGIELDAANNVYIAGIAGPGLPATAGGFDPTTDGNDSFVSKIAASGASVLWTTYVGGSGTTDRVEDLAVDAGGNIAVVGYTDASNFPTTAGAFDTTFAGGPTGEAYDAFAMKLTTTGALAWSTFIGGNNWDSGSAVALDAAGGVCFAGSTKSTDFPLVNAFQTAMLSTWPACVARIDPSGASLTWSSYLGGSGANNVIRCAALNASGQLYVAGNTNSTDFPGTAFGFQPTPGGSYDAIITKITGASGTPSIAWSSYFGGSGMDMIQGIAVSGSSVYVSGTNFYGDLPTVPPSSPPGGFADGFLARIIDANAVTAGTGSLTFTTTVNVNPPSQGVTLNNGGASPATWSATDDAAWLAEAPSSGTLAAGATTTMDVSVIAAGLGVGTYTGAITVEGLTIDVTLVVQAAPAPAPAPGGGGSDGRKSRACGGSAGVEGSGVIVLIVTMVMAWRMKR